MADITVVRGAPPAALMRTFDAVAKALGAMGQRRYVIADAAGTVAYALQPPRKRRLCAELHNRASGGLTPAEARRRARSSYRSYARMIVDTLWIHAIGLNEMFDHGSIDNVEILHNARDAGKGAVLVIAHLGSWDIAASLALAAGYPVSTVMAPVGPPWITELLAWSRKVKNMELFTPMGAARGLLRALREGRMVALLIDIPEGGPTTTVEFCNGPVDFSTGPAYFARRTGAPIIPAECWRTQAGYRLRFRDPIFRGKGEDDTAVTQRVATILEEGVRRLPEQWYPFNEIYKDRM